MYVLFSVWSAFVVVFPNIIGVFLPPFVEVLNKDVKNDWERYIVSLITCLLVAILMDWKEIASGSPQNTFFYATMIFVESNTIYKLYFVNSRLQGFIKYKVIPRLPSSSPSPSPEAGESGGE